MLKKPKRIYVQIWDFWRNSGRFRIHWPFQWWIPQFCTYWAEFPLNSPFQITGHRDLGTNLCLYHLLFPLCCFQNLEASIWDSLFQLYLGLVEDSLAGRRLEWDLLKSLPTQIFCDFGKIFPLSLSFSHFPWFPCQVRTALRVKILWRFMTKVWLKY